MTRRSTAAPPWNRTNAAHLLRRAGFSPAEEEIRAAVDAGLEATVERLVRGTEESPRHAELDETGRVLATRDNIDALRGWWLLRLCHTRRPLRARMALFWHNHFATSNAKVRSAAMMLQQLRSFESLGLGGFERLLQAISRDPAMIIWLDGNQNVKGRPNENYARELFELFSLGVGNYSEADIKEAARAFTGWHTRGGSFHFSAREHDGGRKTVLGEAGAWTGDDVVSIALRRPACSRFLATKLLREFVCPNPPPELIDTLAATLVETGYDIAATLTRLFTSGDFFDPMWRRARIKSPVEFAVGVVRTLGIAPAAAALADGVSQMGQRLFEPPSVKGWEGHRAWLNSATMLVRLNAVTLATESTLFDAAAFRRQYDLDSRNRLIEFCEQLVLDGEVPHAVRIGYPPEGDDLDATLRGVLRALLSSPEYQMA
ncbi:MAG: DUF1800 domain-containing protein [Phycisphaerales bacterium]|nr:DUF1800 domain-containing protein [Phycisphaerales bacterium]